MLMLLLQSQILRRLIIRRIFKRILTREVRGHILEQVIHVKLSQEKARVVQLNKIIELSREVRGQLRVRKA